MLHTTDKCRTSSVSLKELHDALAFKLMFFYDDNATTRQRDNATTRRPLTPFRSSFKLQAAKAKILFTGIILLVTH